MGSVSRYSTTLKTKPFLYRELKKVATLKQQGIKDFEINDKAIRENLFQVNSETRKREIASTVLHRLKTLDDFLLESLVKHSNETGKLLAIYTIMKTDRLFFEFMYEVFREKLLLRIFSIEDKDFNLFFDRKKEQSETVADWQDYTFYKLKQVYIRILFEADLIKNQKHEREINRPILDESVKKHLKALGEQDYLNALLGEVT